LRPRLSNRSISFRKSPATFSQFANIEYIKPERFDVSEVIHALVNLYNADSHLQIRWKHEQRNFDIMSDKTQINRLFTNLIKNALEASTEKKTAYISINQFAQNGHVVISLSDKGHGIERSLQSKIFDPNFTTKSSGTGLGLAICKAIVEKANGKIWFETEPGRGTTFFVELPLAQ
jgi:signal transduction histidine kinase